MKLKATSDIGYEVEANLGPLSTSVGLSWANGYTANGSFADYGIEVSARPGGNTLGGAVVVGGVLIFPEAIPALATQIPSLLRP